MNPFILIPIVIAGMIVGIGLGLGIYELQMMRHGPTQQVRAVTLPAKGTTTPEAGIALAAVRAAAGQTTAFTSDNMQDIKVEPEERRRRAAEAKKKTKLAMKLLKPMGFELKKDGIAILGVEPSISVDTQNPDIYGYGPGDIIDLLVDEAFEEGRSFQRRAIRDSLGVVG